MDIARSMSFKGHWELTMNLKMAVWKALLLLTFFVSFIRLVNVVCYKKLIELYER